MTRPAQPEASTSFFSRHPRNWRENLYVYPVISRRSGGLSIGINLNPDKACNFDCVYCQVDRTVPPVVRRVDLERLEGELEGMVRLAADGSLFREPEFADVPGRFRRITDIAFSGDGEPTTSPQFPAAVRMAAAARERFDLEQTKLVLITDAAYLTRPRVREALAVMDASNGEIWAKLDAGTTEYYELINRPNVPLATILENILDAARERPIVIQSLWMRVRGEPPPVGEVDAFARRLREITDGGGRIRLVQVYTIARRTAEPWVTPLSDAALHDIAAHVRAVAGLHAEVFGSA